MTSQCLCCSGDSPARLIQPGSKIGLCKKSENPADLNFKPELDIRSILRLVTGGGLNVGVENILW